MEKIADDLPPTAWRKILRPPLGSQNRATAGPVNVKQRIVRRRGYEVLQLKDEDYARFDYQPVGCKQPYRIVVLRKVISHEKGEQRLFDEVRYFFYITRTGRVTPVSSKPTIAAIKENDCPTREWGRALSTPGRQPVQQLGLHGDDQHRLELPQGLVGTVAAGVGPLASIRRRNIVCCAWSSERVRQRLSRFPARSCALAQLIWVLSYNPHLPVFFRLAKALPLLTE